MEKHISLLLGLIGVFILGGDATFELYDIKNVEPYRWAITSFFTIAFLITGLTRKTKNRLK